MELSYLLFIVAGLAALLAAGLPRLLSGIPFSMPLAFLLGGFVLYQLPLPLPDIDPVAHTGTVEHLTVLVVIVSLMGAGLSLDRPPGLKSWSGAWRMLGLTMPLTIGVIAALAGWGLGWPVAAALLLGAVLAPTDPVLASDVQVGKPAREREDEEVRFTLTCEAGLNDGLAFPFVYAALAAAAASGTSWLLDWALVDVGYRLLTGLGAGAVIGFVLGRLFFRTRLHQHADGFVALAATFLTYGLTEIIGGYGFVAVFVAAVAIRASERDHGYHEVLHGFIEQIERLLTAAVLLLLGGAIAGGVLAPLTWPMAGVGLAVVLLIRPACGLLAQIGTRAGRRERAAVAFFGIRGIGSLFYVAYAAGQASFGIPEGQLWAMVSFVVLVSVILHGVTATPVMNGLDRIRHARLRRRGITDPTDHELANEHV